MSKRGRADTLTGGTKDVNPQQYKLLSRIPEGVYTPASGAVVQRAFYPVPVNRLQQQGGKAIVMELLKVRWGFAQGFETSITAPPFQLNTTAAICTSLIQTPDSFNPAVIDYCTDSFFFQPSTLVGTEVTDLVVSGSSGDFPIVNDLTDGAGHGILVATDQIYLIISGQIIDFDSGAQYPSAAVFTSIAVVAELIYRFKEVTLTEYIGIVQSQQSPSGLVVV